MWYCATSGVDVLARRFRFTSDTLFVKVCQHQRMIGNGLFEETNEECIFSKVFYISNILHFEFPVYKLQ